MDHPKYEEYCIEITKKGLNKMRQNKPTLTEETSTQPSKEEMVELLSRTIVQQDADIKLLKAERDGLSEELAKITAFNTQLESQLKGLEDSIEQDHNREANEYDIIEKYLWHKIESLQTNVRVLRNHITEFPEDNLARETIQNNLFIIAYLHEARLSLHKYSKY
jgi:chromosome segregation ATPase